MPRRMNAITISCLLLALFVGYAFGGEFVQPVAWRKTNVRIVGLKQHAIIAFQHGSMCEGLTKLGVAGTEFSVPDDLKKWCKKLYKRSVVTTIEKGCPVRQSPNVFATEVSTKLKAMSDSSPISVSSFKVSLGVVAKRGHMLKNLNLDSFATYRDASTWTGINTDTKGLSIASEIDKHLTHFIHETSYISDDSIATDKVVINTSEVISAIADDFAVTKSVLETFFDKFKNGTLDESFKGIFPDVLSSICATCPIDLIVPQSCASDTKMVMFELTLREVDTKRTILAADPFTPLVDEKKKTCSYKYVGPNNIVFENDSGCSSVLPTSSQIDATSNSVSVPNVPANCSHVDVGNKFIKTSCSRKGGVNLRFLTQQKVDKSSRIIYCHNSNIVIAGENQQKCGAKAYRVPKSKRVSVGGVELPPNVNDNDMFGDLISSIELGTILSDEEIATHTIDDSDTESLFEEAIDWVNEYDYGGKVNKKIAPVLTSSAFTMFIISVLAGCVKACLVLRKPYKGHRLVSENEDYTLRHFIRRSKY